MSLKTALGKALQIGLGVVSIEIPALNALKPLVAQINPGAGSALDKVSAFTQGSEFTAVLGIVGQIQGMAANTNPPMTNDQKRQAAATLVEQVVLTSSAFAGHKIQDEAKFKATVEKLSGDFADLVDCFKDDPVQVQKA